MPIISDIQALEILDSRGRPTVQASCRLNNHSMVIASIPSGASTGCSEAHELRDGDPKRYRGRGCRKAVDHVNGEIRDALVNKDFSHQEALDHFLIELDGTSDKSRLGANAILAVSVAFARTCAIEQGVPLYHHFSTMSGIPLKTMPQLTINLFSGGHHAGWQVPIQDALVVPSSARSIDEGLAMTYEIYQSAADLILHKYGLRALSADEGGLAPQFENADHMLQDLVEAIERAGFKPGVDVHLAVDVASSHFYQEGHYHIGFDLYDGNNMVDYLEGWIKQYPIVSLEDGLAEEDWEHWPLLKKRISDRALIMGDDFLCTNPTRIKKAIATDSANALLLKVNQIGTLTEALEAYRIARDAGWKITISARSGETEDNWLADLAVGWGGDQIKIGSITQSERLAKYNRLLAIEQETRLPLVC